MKDGRQIAADFLLLSRRQTAGVAELRRGFDDDDRTEKMRKMGSGFRQ